MGRKVDPRDFLLNTDYEMDKIIFFAEGEIGLNESKEIPHKFPFMPLVFGVCAFNADFSDPRTLPFNYMTPDNVIGISLEALPDVIRIGYGNYESSPAKIYYRIYAFEPSDSRATIGPTAKYAKQFILNTDYNYCKLFKKGVISKSGVTTIDHKLDYIPQVLTWSETTNSLRVDSDAKITGTSLLINIPTSSNIKKIHYRIYYDEA